MNPIERKRIGNLLVEFYGLGDYISHLNLYGSYKVSVWRCGKDGIFRMVKKYTREFHAGESLADRRDRAAEYYGALINQFSRRV